MVAFHDQLAVLSAVPSSISQHQPTNSSLCRQVQRVQSTYQPQQVRVFAKVHRLKVVGDERLGACRAGRVEVDLCALEGFVQGWVAGL